MHNLIPFSDGVALLGFILLAAFSSLYIVVPVLYTQRRKRSEDELRDFLRKVQVDEESVTFSNRSKHWLAWFPSGLLVLFAILGFWLMFGNSRSILSNEAEAVTIVPSTTQEVEDTVFVRSYDSLVSSDNEAMDQPSTEKPKYKSILAFSGQAYWEIAEDPQIRNYLRTMAMVGFALLGSFIGGLIFIFRLFIRNNLIPIKLTEMCVKNAIIILVVFSFSVFFRGANFTNGESILFWSFIAGFGPHFRYKRFIEVVKNIVLRRNTRLDNMPFSYIEGLNEVHKIQLREVGIDNIQNLSKYNFIMLLLKTSFPVRQVMDWVGQAKLAEAAREDYLKFRDVGIRTVLDLKVASNDFEEGRAALSQSMDVEEQLLKNMFLNFKIDASIVFLDAVNKNLKETDLIR